MAGLAMFSSPIDSLTLDDVRDFCESRMPEGTRIDYKRDFPGDLAKLIAAFANTHGGIILIGVAEQDTVPVLPITGIDLAHGLRDRVTTIAVQAISPPVVPEVGVVEIPRPGDGEEPPKCVVVVRVPESADSPHAIEKNTRVYVRTGSQASPVEAATLDRIEWLSNRRAKAQELQRRLAKRAADRSMLVSNALGEDGTPRVDLTLFIGPKFPHEPLMPAKQVLEFAEAREALLFFRANDRHGICFPFSDSRPRPVVGGAAGWESRQDRVFAEFNEFGFFTGRVSISARQLEPDDPTRRDWPDPIAATKVVDVYALAAFIAALLAKGLGFLSRLEFPGIVEAEFTVHGTKGCLLDREDYGRQVPGGICLDDRVMTMYAAPFAELLADRLSIVHDFIGRVLWAFNYRNPEALIEVFDGFLTNALTVRLGDLPEAGERPAVGPAFSGAAR